MWLCGILPTNRLQPLVGALKYVLRAFIIIILSYYILFNITLLLLFLNHNAKVQTKNEKNEGFVLINVKRVKIFQLSLKIQCEMLNPVKTFTYEYDGEYTPRCHPCPQLGFFLIALQRYKEYLGKPNYFS